MTFSLIGKLDEAAIDLVSEIKILLNDTRNEVALLQYSILQKYKQEDVCDDDAGEFGFDDFDNTDFEARNPKVEFIKDEDVLENKLDDKTVTNESPVAINFLKIYKEKKLKTEKIKKKKLKCRQCYKRFPEESFENHSCEKKVSNFICNICGQIYKHKHHLNYHHKVAHENYKPPKLHICHQCEFRCTSKKDLRRHLETHEEKKPCPECGLKVRQLNAHIKTVHTPDEMKNQICKDCGKGFLNLGKLNKHRMSVHLKLRPYNCRYGCDISYNDTSNRNQHEKKSHGKLFTANKEER